MSVASLELSKRLYELSGWKDTDYRWYTDDGTFLTHEKLNGLWLPAYDLSYMLNKLPPYLDLNTPKIRDLFIGKFPHGYLADYRYRDSNRQFEGGGWWHIYDKARLTEAETAENATAKLCISLFKNGILTKDSQKGSA